MKHQFDETRILHLSIETHCGSPGALLRLQALDDDDDGIMTDDGNPAH